MLFRSDGRRRNYANKRMTPDEGRSMCSSENASPDRRTCQWSLRGRGTEGGTRKKEDNARRKEEEARGNKVEARHRKEDDYERKKREIERNDSERKSPKEKAARLAQEEAARRAAKLMRAPDLT